VLAVLSLGVGQSAPHRGRSGFRASRPEGRIVLLSGAPVQSDFAFAEEETGIEFLAAGSASL